MEVEELSPHAHGLQGGAAAVLRGDGELGYAAVGVQVQPPALCGLQGLFAHLVLQALAEGADVLLRLAAIHRQVAGQLGVADLPRPLEPPGGGQGVQGPADPAQAQGAGDGAQDQDHVEDQKKPLLEAEAPDGVQNAPGQIFQCTHDGFSTIRT